MLATLTTETGASVVSVPTSATGASRHVAVYGALAALLGLVARPAVRHAARGDKADRGPAGRRVPGNLARCCSAPPQERRGQIVGSTRTCPSASTWPPTGPGSSRSCSPGLARAARLASLAARLRGELPSPERADARGAGAHRPHRSPAPATTRARTATCCARRSPAASTGRSAWPPLTGRPASRQPVAEPQRTVVTLNDIRLGAPPPDAALVVACPGSRRTARWTRPQTSGVTADWPILGVIGIRRRTWLASLDRPATARPAVPPRAPDAACRTRRRRTRERPRTTEPRTRCRA